MSISEYISAQPTERQELLSQLHEIIIEKGKTVTPVIVPMMGINTIVNFIPRNEKV